MATNQWTDDDDDFDDEDIQPTQTDAETKRFRDLRKAKKADEKRIKELTEQLENLSKAQRERVIKDVLEAKGVKPAMARFIAKDLDSDITEESVTKWLDDNGELFGLRKEEPQVDPQKQRDLAALRQQDIVTQGAVSPDKEMDAMQRINDAASADEIIAMIQSGNF